MNCKKINIIFLLSFLVFIMLGLILTSRNKVKDNFQSMNQCSQIVEQVLCAQNQYCEWKGTYCDSKNNSQPNNTCENLVDEPMCTRNSDCSWNSSSQKCSEKVSPTTQTHNTTQVSNNVQQGSIGSSQDLSKDNDFYIKDKENDNTIMEIDNIEDYHLENDPVIVGKKFKLLKFFTNSQLRIYRENSDSEKDFTYGFYFKIFETQLPTVFEDFMTLTNNDNSFNLRSNLDLKNNKIIFNFSTNDISNTIQLSFSNPKILNYVVIQIENNIKNNVPTITFNLNNQITKFKFLTKKKLKINNISFKNYEGYIGKVLIYNSIVDKNILCQKFNCNLSCFRPDGSKTYGGDVNKCIKDCMKSCNDVSKCQKICVDCEIEEEEWDVETKLKMCPWLKDIKTLEKNVPDPPKIRGFPGDGKILVEWKKPFNGKSLINNYIVMAYETFNKKSGIQINISSNPTCELCEHEIKNLKNQVYYDIIVKAVNNVGIGPSSNIITIAPNGEKLKNDLNNVFYELDDDLDNNISQEDIDVGCENKGFYNSQNHMLDSDVPILDNYIRNRK